MKTLILLAFMLIANVFAGEAQEIMCDNKSLSYCINHFDRQCKAKNYSACWVVGTLYYLEQEQDSKAKKYYEMVCDKANSKDTFQVELIDGSMGREVTAIFSMQRSCSDLGNFYYNGWGVRQSYKKAFHYHNKACDLGYGKSCAFVGIAYFTGKGVKKDLSRARKFFAKSCELEYDGAGCFMQGVKQNLSKAKELYGKACDLGDQDSCDFYKELKEKGY